MSTTVRTTRLFVASTLYGVATLAAAVDAGRFEAADRSLLLLCNNASVPETSPSVDEMPGFEALRGRFDGVLSWNETIAPFHPGAWAPRADDVPLWERHLRLEWELGDDRVELVVESIQVSPASSICQIFAAAPIDVYADGLMSYGPTRNKIDPLIGTRVRRLLHPDLVPGLKPLLLTEFGVEPETLSTDHLLKVFAELADMPVTVPPVEGPALLLGQYLSALGLIEVAEEEELHLRMIRGSVALGHTRLVFKPHPTAPAHWSHAMAAEASALGAELTVLARGSGDAGTSGASLLAEVLYQRMRPALVVGCFSTALLTASAFYGLPVARTGTELLLDRLAPYQNSNRVPVTLVDALLPDLGDAQAVRGWSPPSAEQVAEDVHPLLTAVGFAMQPQIYPDLRPAAESYLAQHLHDRTRRYFKRRRLTTLALPGAVPAQLGFIPRSPALRKVARRARALKRAVLR
ncbi:polysialyltransferase family glycosyltransferase [Streptomyces sp. NPDC019224]|uniref:polysialyltransferase family glycosyltransferase n=1 Tax=Streptomyces sp. NPDC019224 TaxID=3154484 RepID=UPI0033FF874C